MNGRIKELRKALGLTQQEFANKLKISRNTLATYEMGRSEPSGSAFALICRIFNVNENWLRTGEGEMFIQLSRDEEIASFIGSILNGETDTFKRRLVSILSRLDESDWEVLEKMAEKIKKD